MTYHIGISGAIGAGKSTLARSLEQIFLLKRYAVTIIPFAKGVKYLGSLYDNPDAGEIAAHYFISLGYTEKQAYKGAELLLHAFDTYPLRSEEKPRKLYQYIGTELGRETIDPDIWIKATQKEISACNKNIVISDDLRFVNESYAVDYHISLQPLSFVDELILTVRRLSQTDTYFYADHKSEQERNSLKEPDMVIGLCPTVLQVLDLTDRIIGNLTYENARLCP